MMEEYKTTFLAYNPQLKPSSSAQGGGFVIALEIPETEYEAIKDLNNPKFKQYQFSIGMVGRKI